MFMEKPNWVCGNSENWKRMAPSFRLLDFSGKLTENVGKTLACETAASLCAVGVTWFVGGGHSVVNGAGALLTFMVMLNSVAGLNEYLWERNTFLTKVVELVGRKRLSKAMEGESASFRGDLLKTSKAARSEASSRRLDHVTKNVMEAIYAAEQRMERRRADETEGDRAAAAARSAAPKAFEAGDEWKPSDMSRRMSRLGAHAGDGVAALGLAEAIMQEKSLEQSQKAELEKIAGELLPKLLDAYEAVPAAERETRLPELDKSPDEAFKEGLAAALGRVLAVRAGLTARAKVSVAAESNVIKAGP